MGRKAAILFIGAVNEIFAETIFRPCSFLGRMQLRSEMKFYQIVLDGAQREEQSGGTCNDAFFKRMMKAIKYQLCSCHASFLLSAIIAIPGTGLSQTIAVSPSQINFTMTADSTSVAAPDYPGHLTRRECSVFCWGYDLLELQISSGSAVHFGDSSGRDHAVNCNRELDASSPGVGLRCEFPWERETGGARFARLLS